MTSYWAGQDLMTDSNSKVLILTSAMLALAASDSCSDCTAVVSHIAGRLSTPESLAAQGVPFLSTSPLKIHFLTILVMIMPEVSNHKTIKLWPKLFAGDPGR